MRLRKESERAELAEILWTAFPDTTMFGQFLLQRMNENLGKILANNGSPIGPYEKVVQYFEGPRFADFLTQVLQVRSDIPELNAYYARLQERTGAPAMDYLHRCCILMGANYFINRHRLRNEVADISDEHGPRVLVVNGPARSGRSFTATYIVHFCDLHGGTPYLVDFKRQFLGKSPLELVRRLALSFQWNASTIPEQHAQATQWVEELGEWVAGNVRNSQETIWLIFDDANAHGLAQPMREFIVYLADKTFDVPQLRIVLLAYAEPMLGPARMRMREESVLLPTKHDVRSFLADLRIVEKFDIEEPALDELSEQIWRSLPAEQERVLETLPAAIRIAMEVYSNG